METDIEGINDLSRVMLLDTVWVSHLGLSKAPVHALIACVAYNDCMASGFSGKQEMEQKTVDHLRDGAGSRRLTLVIQNKL
jgi:hypothetical protein